jgi:spermidine synthase
VQRGVNQVIKVNGHYGLGSSEADFLEKGQASIPLMLHPRAKSVFFLGMGTGITAGEALSPKYGLERIVSCELVPEVVTAARKHFSEYTHGLFNDPRSRVIVDDGRHYLAATEEKFDIINSDLFMVYRRGAGSLYSLEHFQIVKERLSPGGIFVQWIPIYQLTEKEFFIIARTMLEVFPQITVWRNQFHIWKDAIALVAQNEKAPLLVPGYREFSLEKRQAALQAITEGRTRPNKTNLLLYYCGNLSGAGVLFKNTDINTDNRPLIEYMTPHSSSLQAADKVVWFTGPKFVGFIERLFMMTPPENDPSLAHLSRGEKRAARAGYYLARSYLFRSAFERRVPGANRSWLAIAEQARNDFFKYWGE